MTSDKSRVSGQLELKSYETYLSLRPRTSGSNLENKETRDVSVIIPAYKEEEHIEATLRGIANAFRTAGLSYEIVVVIDLVPGDETATRVKKASEVYDKIRIIQRYGRRGVGDAIRTGIKDAKGRTVIPVMGDQSEYPMDIVRLAREARHYDVVFTNRFKHGRPPGYPTLKYVANRATNILAMLVFGIPYSDITNAFKAYKKQVLDRIDLSSNGFEIFLEIPLKAMMLFSLKTSEVYVRHTVKQKRMPKLSVFRDGYKYACLLLRLLFSRASLERYYVRQVNLGKSN